MTISAEIIGGSNLSNATIERQQTVDVRIRVTHSGLTGAQLRFVAKLPEYASDEDDARAVINKHSGTNGGITIDAASNDTILIARMRISASDTSNLLPNTQLDWGIQLKNAIGEITLPELRGKLTVAGDIVKTI